MEIKVIFSGDEYFRILENLIKNATKEVLLESYIFDLDPIGYRILHALNEAKNKGLQVKLLVDGVGGFNWLTKLEKECFSRDINFRIFHPIPFGQKIFMLFSFQFINRINLVFQKINKRNHRKLCLIDRSTLLIGSFNISKVHSERFMLDAAWRDTGLLIKSSALNPKWPNQIVECFFQAWGGAKIFSQSNLLKPFSRYFKKRQASESVFLMNYRPALRRKRLKKLIQKIKTAKNEILITNPYFLPTRNILRQLIKAAKRGVHVVLIVPEKTDIKIINLVAPHLYLKLIKSQIQIFKFQNRMLHAKTLIVDNWCTIGTYNLNHRSLLHDLEIEATLENIDVLSKLKEQWKLDLENSVEVKIEDIENRSILKKTISSVFYWFRYWL